MMYELIEKIVPLDGVSVLIGVSEWLAPENWSCPADSYVVCQRLSEGHSPLRLTTDDAGTLEVYPQVRSLGFMPSTRGIVMYPLERQLRTLNCFFDKAFFEETTGIDADGWYDRSGSFMMLSNRTIENLMRTIHSELLQPGFGSEQMIEAASTMIAVEMARLGRQANRSAASTLSAGNQGLAPWQMRRIRERLDSAGETGYPGIQELAQLCGISRSHLMRMFKASTGQPLQRFVMVERLNAARRMLADDKLSIKEIGAVLGFCNTAHFSNAFRRAEGMAPSEFRNRSRVVPASASGNGSSHIH
ncbi:helix-turn-helix domain-containing protein [Novosphingobium album (ex Hu et al. 2023)]|uniref:AraC family transcriptional regulator n=1 Tax=Novosphingobium album (ex Hu et al. 2023) TaxID=2930093 RepID=A0ABT0B743_9SPHN|nr:AraC family transcriptional regulator [Novosphingobium album (ex Hu et al. 2023)]MCJ2180866.1 AraC family transcriptional regulator [Novosphingobium album (ex Hu et al. 2023)]